MSEKDTKLPEEGGPCPMDGLKKPSFFYRLIHRMLRPLAKLPGVSCRSYTQICAGKKDCVLTVGQRLELAGHWLLCGVCRSFSKQIDVLDEMSGELGKDEDVASTTVQGECCLSEAERTELKRGLTEGCNTDAPKGE